MSSGTAQWRPMIRTAAQEFGPPRHLIEAVMQLESGGDKTNVTNTGVAACPQAFGLMQIACGCSAVSCDEFTPILDPQINIRAGARHLKTNFDQCGSWDGAICAYFSGHCMPNGIAVDIFGTTDQRYVDVVKANWAALDLEDPEPEDGRPVAGTLPDGFDLELAARWYESAENDGTIFKFAEDDEVCRLWLGLGRYPGLVWADDFDTRGYFRFSDGTVIWRSGEDIPYCMLQLPHRMLGMTPANSLNYPEGMDHELAERWFGTAENNGETFGFSETDEVSQRWLMLGRFPSLVWTNDFGSRTYFRFNDGTVIWRPSPELPYRVLESPPVGGSLYPAGVDRDLATLWFGSASNDG